jgi:hypothetical protein
MEQNKLISDELSNQENGYIDDTVDEIADIRSLYRTKSSYLPAEEVIESLANEFNLSIHEIEEIIHNDE